MTSAPHRDLRLVGLVAAGGAFGSLARYALAATTPQPAGWPLGTLLVNVTGAFALGALLEVLGRRGPETPRTQQLRLALGTGVLGGYTTFSALALEIERLLAAGRTGLALVYALSTMVGGLAAAGAGVAVASRGKPRRAVVTAGGLAVPAEPPTRATEGSSGQPREDGAG